jgi:hypothetical protein
MAYESYEYLCGLSIGYQWTILATRCNKQITIEFLSHMAAENDAQ